MDNYQLNYEDIIHAELVAQQPGRTAYIDECGGFGFEFNKPDVSAYYVVCAVIVDNEKILAIENKIEEIKKLCFGGGEMKSSSISANHARRAKVLTELLMLDIQLIVLIANKKEFIEGSPLTEYKRTFKKFLNQRLFDTMYRAYPKLKIVEDEYGTDEFQESYKNYIRNNRPRPNLFNEYDFDYADSRKSNIVQVADIIAGSVVQRLNDLNAPDVLQLFRGRITDIVNFPDSYAIYKPTESCTKHDIAVYMLACKCAKDYINANSNAVDEEKRLRVLFLRILLYNIQMSNNPRYIHSGELVHDLARLSEKRVTKDYLYRRIVAPLRDEGILIASSAHGYKIPNKVADIEAYINQTVSVVGPMLSRVGKCRAQIRKITDGQLDILENDALSGYKRYFGDY